MNRFTWAKTGGYECSSKGDKRFSALFARLEDGRTVEQWYQCDIKGYDPGGIEWRIGKGKPALDKSINLWKAYLNLWVRWATLNPELICELRLRASETNFTLSDRFASSRINQANALSVILNNHQQPLW